MVTKETKQEIVSNYGGNPANTGAVAVQVALLTARINDLQDQVEELSKASTALDWFWQINEAYVRGRYSLARSLIEEMGEELPQYLPKESATDNDRFSPADRYQEIYDAVM